MESLTDDAAFRLGISIEKEEFEIGKWIKSINGVESSGWEFTVDGQRASLGIEHAEIDNESIVRWKNGVKLNTKRFYGCTWPLAKVYMVLSWGHLLHW